jgi:predicted dehydrogenase
MIAERRPPRRLLVAGAGSIGRRHIANLRACGVSDLVLYRQRPLSLEEAPELPVFTRLDDALATGPDAVVVATPTAHHIDVALAAARAGCHLLVEKPLSHTWNGVEALLDVVARRRLIGMAGFDLRFDPGLARVKALIDHGTIGRLVIAHAQVGQYLPEWHPWEDYRHGGSAQVGAGGGVLLDLIHELDYMRWLLGPVASVVCAADHLSSLEIETEDAAALLLRFSSGAIGTIHLDYIQRTISRTCRIVGEEGTILWDGVARTVAWYEARSARWHRFEYPSADRNQRFLEEIAHFLDCLDGRAEPPVDLAAAAEVLRLTLAARQSAGLPATARTEEVHV